MREKTEKRSKGLARNQMLLTAVLLLACVVLFVGAAWARYRTESFNYLNYGVKEPDSLLLWSSYNEETGALSGKSSWQISDGTGTMDFYISNGTVDHYAESNKEISVRLSSSLTSQEIEAWLTLGGTKWKAEAQPIRKGTALAKQFGEGQVYLFKNEDGAELTWTLAGGALSVLPAQFYVAGLGNQDVLFQVQVTEEVPGR